MHAQGRADGLKMQGPEKLAGALLYQNENQTSQRMQRYPARGWTGGVISASAAITTLSGSAIESIHCIRRPTAPVRAHEDDPYQALLRNRARG